MNDTLAGLVGGGAVTPTIVGLFIVLGYFAVVIDRRRDNSSSRDDHNVGVKLVLFALVIAGVLILVGGLQQLFAWAFGGFKATDQLKEAAANFVTGGFVVMTLIVFALPRTNSRTAPQVERFALGVIALFTGLTTIGALNDVIRFVFMGEQWPKIGGSLAQVIAHALVAGLSIARLGRLSNWGGASQQAQPPYQQGYPSGQSYQAPYTGQQGYGGGQGFPPQGYQR